jgi:hypothetical protein
MAKRKRKPKELTHLVTGDLRLVELTRAGSALTLEIVNLKTNKKLGTIEIGQGSFTWWGFKRQKARPWNWTRFAKIMNREAYDE